MRLGLWISSTTCFLWLAAPHGAWAAEPYSPPPLFAAPAKVTLVPPAPDLPAPTAATPMPFPATDDLAKDIAVTPPPPSAAVDSALSVDQLLYHPADRITDKARTVLPNPPPPILPGRAQPILDGPPAKTAATAPPAKPAVPTTKAKVTTTKPVAKKAVIAKAAPKVEPKVERKVEPKVAAIEPTAPADVLELPITPTKPATIKSPSPTIKKIIQENPKVMVYSRDTESGEFRRVDPKNRIVRIEGKTKVMGVDLQKVDKEKTPAYSHPSAMPPSETNPEVAKFGQATKKKYDGIPDLIETDLSEVLVEIRSEEQTMNQIAMAAPAVPVERVNMANLPPPPPAIVKNATTSNKLAATSIKSEQKPDTPLEAAPTIRLTFDGGVGDLSDPQRRQMDDDVLPSLSSNLAAKAEIIAFAAPTDSEPNADRRIALARGLAVREYLKSQGIDSDRLVLRAMGQNSLEQPLDRVDIVIR